MYLLMSHFPCEIKVSESFNSFIHYAMSLVLLLLFSVYVSSVLVQALGKFLLIDSTLLINL